VIDYRRWALHRKLQKVTAGRNVAQAENRDLKAALAHAVDRASHAERAVVLAHESAGRAWKPTRLGGRRRDDDDSGSAV
jgi:hypothetical protein